MSAFDIVAIVVLSCIVVGVTAYLIYRRVVKGKGPDCDCDCDACSMCSHCNACKNAQELQKKKKSDK